MSQIRPVIEHLTGRKHLVLFDKREDVERHLIATHAIGELKVVAAPRHITDAIGEDSRHDIDYNTAAKSNRFGTQDKPNKNVIRTWATTQEKSIQRISRPK